MAKKKKRFDIGKFWKGRKQPAKTRMKRSRAIKKMLKAGKFKIWNKGKHLSARHKEKLRISNLKTYESMILRQKIDRIMTAWWREHPNIRKEVSEKAKRMFISHPERFKKFMKNGKNPFSAKIRTKNGFFVRSKGEKEIANFLFENEIKAEYESKTLIFEKEGQICVPDFWLPRYKIYIEFYGGYPGAWKKKVMKNKLYKKYKIPCIFITPNELRNLNYYLRGELSAG
ncbi:hypothetical protein COS75_00495 [Candidatus Pacearchaeota archaeon CG06_land_8_20_14_3_00_35_12]|nr:MAG: hypothetical protein COS75_00495 [Candidatus Pacearchaeota archaeon CG06_land_8_20_14_3_00_35_12]